MSLAAAAAVVASIFLAKPASADVTLVEKDGWSVFTNGRLQAFLSYNKGEGRPLNLQDANNCQMGTDANGNPITFCNPVELRGGGVDQGAALPEWPEGTDLQSTTDPGNVEELRIRTGFTGNVLGFGIKNQITKNTEAVGYAALTIGIDSAVRRKFSEVLPDWRESYFRVTGPWGSVSAGRQLTLLSRGATEITYLYGYKYGLGFPGVVSTEARSSAGMVGFGVLGNGFGAGLTYTTPNLSGFQLTVGAYDANNIVATPFLERTRWPRPEAEASYSMDFGGGMFKLFVNGAWQEVYDYQGSPRKVSVWGSGFGGRVEIGPVHVGLASHIGKGIGVTYSLEPHGSLYFVEKAQADPLEPVIMRDVAGYYGHVQVSATKSLDLNAGAGLSQVKQLDEDVNAWNPDPNTATTGIPSVGFVTIRQQVGIGAGATYHFPGNVHLTGEFFRAMFQWYKPTPAQAGAAYPTQNLNFVNVGLTYDW